jgi:subtilisin
MISVYDHYAEWSLLYALLWAGIAAYCFWTAMIVHHRSRLPFWVRAGLVMPATWASFRLIHAVLLLLGDEDKANEVMALFFLVTLALCPLAAHSVGVLSGLSSRPPKGDVMASTAPDEIKIGLPDFTPGDDLPYDEVMSPGTLARVLADGRPWSHAPLGIPDLYAAGVRGKGATVAVIDTGCEWDHHDLAANIDRQGSRDYTGSPVSWADKNGHGTHCSGIVAADDQGSGVIGVAPDATVVVVKGLSDAGSGGIAGLVNSIRHAADTPAADVLSMSFGAANPIPEIEAALKYAESKGKWLVAAAGNSGPNSTNWPGAYPNVLCVAATEEDGKVAPYSSTNDSVDVAAPGSAILSTVPGNKYASLSGTSMATPFVAGVLALAVAEIRKAGKKVPSQAAMMKAVYATSRDIGLPGYDPASGSGLIQPAALIAELVRLAGAGTTPPPPPGVKVHRVTVPRDVDVIEITRA